MVLFYKRAVSKGKRNLRFFYPVRNNAPLLPPGQRPSGPAAAAGLDFRIIPAGFNAPLEFLTGFTNMSLIFSQSLFCQFLITDAFFFRS
jgi:hypothetical protein